MSHQRLIARLEAQRVVLESTEHVEQLAEALVKEMAIHVPRDTGTMAGNLLQVTPPRKTATGAAIGIGDKSKIGNPYRAPRNTISQFKEWVRINMSLKKFREWFPHPPANSAYAWWVLPKEAKEELQRQREGGLFGGGYQGVGTGKSAYFYQQEGSQPEWAASAALAGITPQEFVAYALDVWKSSRIAGVMERFHYRLSHPEY